MRLPGPRGWTTALVLLGFLLVGCPENASSSLDVAADGLVQDSLQDSLSVTDILSDPGPCTPNCTGKLCGDNGCGGHCGVCDPSASCVAGQCIGDDGDVVAPLDVWEPPDTSTAGDLAALDLFDTMAHESDTGTVLVGDVFAQDEWGWTGDSTYWEPDLSDTYGAVDWSSWDYGSWDYGSWDWGGYEWDEYGYDGGIYIDVYNDDWSSWDAGSNCGDLTWEGVCVGDTLIWCSFGEVEAMDCGAMSPTCGCAYVPEWGFSDCIGDCW